MKLAQVFLNFCFIVQCKTAEKLEVEPKIASNLALATSFVAAEHWSDDIKTTNLIVPDDSKDFLMRDFKDELFGEISNSNAIFRQHLFATNIPERRTIIVLRDFKNFLNIFYKMNSKNFKSSGMFLIVLINGVIKEIEEIFKLF
jgi:hypothetical protein